MQIKYTQPKLRDAALTHIPPIIVMYDPEQGNSSHRSYWKDMQATMGVDA